MTKKVDHTLWLRERITGFWLARAIQLAASLNLADHLKAGPQNIRRLSRITRTEPTSLYRLLRALASEGVFVEKSERTFALTPKASLLRSDHPHSLRGYAIWYGTEPWSAFDDLGFSIATGKAAFKRQQRIDYFSFLKTNRAASARFDAAMSSVSLKQARAVLSGYDFSKCECIADVGGGEGLLLSAILKKHPGTLGMLIDVESVIRSARKASWWKESARCTFKASNFFRAVPVGADTYILKYILHDWDDARCKQILTNIAKVLPKTGRLLIIEQLIDKGNEPQFAKLADLHMLALLQGRERTLAEFKELLTSTGLVLKKVHSTGYLLRILEAKLS